MPIAPSDHFDGKVFHNIDPAARTRPLSEVWKWHRARNPATWPKWIEDPAPSPIPAVDAETIAVTWLGHSSFLVQIGGVTLLTDPVFALHAGPYGLIGPRRVRAPAFTLEQLPPIDLILQSHNHYDHLDLGAHRRLGRRGAPLVVTPLGNRAYLPRPVRSRVTELDWWEATEARGLTITVVPAQHFSARTPFDRDRALWGGFVVTRGTQRLYFAGDSGYGPHFKEIGARFPGLGVGLVPIGAYEPRWFMGPVHVDPTQAVQAHRDLGVRQSVAMHFGTFQLTDEGIDDPVIELIRARDAAGLDAEAFLVPTPGETFTFR